LRSRVLLKKSGDVWSYQERETSACRVGRRELREYPKTTTPEWAAASKVPFWGRKEQHESTKNDGFGSVETGTC